MNRKRPEQKIYICFEPYYTPCLEFCSQQAGEFFFIINQKAKWQENAGWLYY